MSLKNKLEAIKKDVETKKVVEEITEGKESLREVVDQKLKLAERISDLKSLVSQVKESYSSSEASLENFKESFSNIKDLFSEYAGYLKERGINSVEEIIRSDDFKGETEVKEFHEAGASKLEDGDTRGRLGKSVEAVTSAKTAVKEALPDMKLDFRGKKEGGADISPREASILKIENYISDLEKELEEMNKQEAEKTAEHMPKIKEMINLHIDKLLSQDNIQAETKAANLSFLDDKIMELGGDELWPQIKETAQKLILEKRANWHTNEINDSLEAEKYIYDINKFKKENREIIELQKEEDSLNYIKRDIESDYFLQRLGQLKVEDGKIYPADLIEKAQSFTGKNAEAKKICEEVIEEYLAGYKALKEKLPSGFLAGKETKGEIEYLSSHLDKAIQEFETIEAPDNFYCKNIHEFTNRLGSIHPHFSSPSGKDWSRKIRKELLNLNDRLSGKVGDLKRTEQDVIHKIVNEVSHFNHEEKTGINGFDIPYKELKSLNSFKSLEDTEKVDEIFQKLEGTSISHGDLVKLLNEEKEAVFPQKNDPNIIKLISKLDELKGKYEQKYKYDSFLIQKKMAAKEGKVLGDRDQKNIYEVKNDLFKV